MSRKNPTANEERMDFLENTFVFEIMREEIRVKKMLIKGGFGDWLMVITAFDGAGDIVCFIGARTLDGIATKLHEQFYSKTMVWRKDKYAK